MGKIAKSSSCSSFLVDLLFRGIFKSDHVIDCACSPFFYHKNKSRVQKQELLKLDAVDDAR